MENIRKYRAKISGPLMDRIDLHIDVPALKKEELMSLPDGENSLSIRNRVEAARQIQIERFQNIKYLHSNAHMDAGHINNHCIIDENGRKLLSFAFDKLNMSARSYDKVLKISRTIADLDNSEDINERHISEALQYRSLDRYDA